MAVWKLLIILGLILNTTAIFFYDDDSNNDSVINYRLPDNVVPTHYNITLMPNIEEENFNFVGESNINVIIRHATQKLSLHILELTIDETVTSLINNDTVYMPAMHNYNNITQILVIHFNDKLSPGNYTLIMRYVGILHHDFKGFVISSYMDEEGKNVMWFVATRHFEPTYARRTFPCWDEPELKATFDISIKHHRNYTALSNMPIREISNDEKDDMIWTHFDTTPTMSTNLVAFVVADYVRVPTEDETINIWCRSKLVPDIKFAKEVVQKFKRLLTKYTNSTSKIPKMDLVALPRFTSSAMENWGLIIFNERSLAYNESFNTISTKLSVAMIIVYKMAHQWLLVNNVVNPLWWSHLRSSEGFAWFLGIHILDQIFEEWQIIEYFLINIQRRLLHFDMNPITLDTNRLEEINLFHFVFDSTPAILCMLKHIITDEVFRNGFIKYLQTYQFNSTTSDDLWNALQAVLDKSDVPHNAYRLKEVMDTWLKQSDFPVVHVTRNNNTKEIILTQEHFVPKNKSEKVNDNKWWIPLTFATQTNPDFSNTLPTHWLKPQDRSITIDGISPKDWIIVNLQQTGFYRVNYDSSNWQKIVNYLKYNDFTQIHPLNRAQIIDDAYHLMMLNQHDIMMFLDLISYLSREIDCIPWYSMFQILSRSEDIYKVPENEILKSYILNILDGLIKNIEYEEDLSDDDLTKLQRTNALKWACTLGHSECRKMATLKMNEHLADPKTHKISPDLKEWTYCNGLMEANASTWNKLYNMYINKPNRMALTYLICSENPDIIINFLNISTSKIQYFTSNSIFNIKFNFNYYVIYSSIIKKHAKNDVIIDYILTNFEQIIPRHYYVHQALADIINNVYSREKLDEISKFIINKFEEKVFEDVQDEIIKRKRLLDTFVSFQPSNLKEKLKL